MNEKDKLTPRVVNEVYQIIEMLPDSDKAKIPLKIMEYLKENAIEIEKYKVDTSIPIDEQDLDDETYSYVYMLLERIKPSVKYETLEPSWEKIEDIKEKVKKLEDEILTNFYNVNNALADRELVDKEFVLNIYYYGLTKDENRQKELKPFIALCKVYNIMYNNLRKTNDYEKALEDYKFVSEELKKNIERTFKD